jgi:hypothetical protein
MIKFFKAWIAMPWIVLTLFLPAPLVFADTALDDIIRNLEPVPALEAAPSAGEAPAGESPGEEAAAEDAHGGENFDEEAYWEQYQGPLVSILHDNRTDSDYIRIEVPGVSITEHHYLKNIKYTDLVFVLTDLLKRITDSGYRYCGEITTTYAPNAETAIVYFEDLVNQTASGGIHFPDFSMSIAGSKNFSPGYHNDISNATTLMSMIMKFILALSQVELSYGYSIEYLLQYFKEAPELSAPSSP